MKRVIPEVETDPGLQTATSNTGIYLSSTRRSLLEAGIALAVVKLLSASPAYAQSTKEPKSAFSRDPRQTVEFFNVPPIYKPELQAVIWADPGYTQASEIDSFDNTPYAASKKEDLGGGYTRYSYPPPSIPTRDPNKLQDRDNILLTKDGVVVAKRRVIGRDTKSDSITAYNKFTDREDPVFLYAPKYYETTYPGRQIWTRFHPKSLGRTLGILLDHLSGTFLELQSFPEGLPIEDYKKLLEQMDAKIALPVEPKAAPPKPTISPPKPTTTAATPPSCDFKLGFRTLRDQIPEIVGDCLEDERFNPDNGNVEQRTTAHHGKGGVLVWRKTDNWTAYTDGHHTWLNGPYGNQKRLNTELFDWEQSSKTASPRKKIAFIPLDGMGSTNLTVVKTFEPIIQAISPSPDIVAPFGPNGWDIVKNPDSPDGTPKFIVKPFGRLDTYRNLLRYPQLLKGLVDEVSKYVDQIYIGGFSEGAFIAWQYLIDELLRKDSAHRGIVTHAMLLAGPLAGIDHEIAPTLFSIFGENAVGNENSEFFAAKFKDPELPIRNQQYANKLRDEAGVKVGTYGSPKDCIVTDKSSVIRGHGRVLSLPRDLPSCSASLIRAVLRGEDPARAAGHNQILTAAAPEARTFYAS